MTTHTHTHTHIHTEREREREKSTAWPANHLKIQACPLAKHSTTVEAWNRHTHTHTHTIDSRVGGVRNQKGQTHLVPYENTLTPSISIKLVPPCLSPLAALTCLIFSASLSPSCPTSNLSLTPCHRPSGTTRTLLVFVVSRNEMRGDLSWRTVSKRTLWHCWSWVSSIWERGATLVDSSSSFTLISILLS